MINKKLWRQFILNIFTLVEIRSATSYNADVTIWWQAHELLPSFHESGSIYLIISKTKDET